MATIKYKKDLKGYKSKPLDSFRVGAVVQLTGKLEEKEYTWNEVIDLNKEYYLVLILENKGDGIKVLRLEDSFCFMSDSNRYGVQVSIGELQVSPFTK